MALTIFNEEALLLKGQCTIRPSIDLSSTETSRLNPFMEQISSQQWGKGSRYTKWLPSEKWQVVGFPSVTRNLNCGINGNMSEVNGYMVYLYNNRRCTFTFRPIITYMTLLHARNCIRTCLSTTMHWYIVLWDASRLVLRVSYYEMPVVKFFMYRTIRCQSLSSSCIVLWDVSRYVLHVSYYEMPVVKFFMYRTMRCQSLSSSCIVLWDVSR